MNNFLVIDGGTTNTRINLVLGGEAVDTIKINIGARIGSENKEALKKGISNAIKELLDRNSLCEAKIEKIIASGMITSEGGLVSVPHLNAPCGLQELALNLFETKIEDVCNIPFAFIRGVKINGEDYSVTDMMRGEETELYGLVDTPYQKTLYLLPGSHNKLILTDEMSRISSFETTLTGEMIFALSKSTILGGSVDLDNSDIDEEYLKKGYLLALEKGINSALFKVRILDKVFSESSQKVYSFFLGAVLSGEIQNILRKSADKIVIGGKSVLKKAICLLLGEYADKEIIVIDDSITESATVRGALKIYNESIK